METECYLFSSCTAPNASVLNSWTWLPRSYLLGSFCCGFCSLINRYKETEINIDRNLFPAQFAFACENGCDRWHRDKSSHPFWDLPRESHQISLPGEIRCKMRTYISRKLKAARPDQVTSIRVFVCDMKGRMGVE